ARFERRVAAAQLVVFGIGDRRRILLVVAPVMLGDLGGEPLELGLRLAFAQVFDGMLARVGLGHGPFYCAASLAGKSHEGCRIAQRIWDRGSAVRSALRLNSPSARATSARRWCRRCAAGDAGPGSRGRAACGRRSPAPAWCGWPP